MINFKTLMKSALVGAVMAMAPLAASAVTVFNVSDNAGGQSLNAEFGIADGGLFSQALTLGDSVSIDVESDGAASSQGAIGFTFAPSPLRANLDVNFGNTDFSNFGSMTVYLSTDGTIANQFASAVVNAAGVYTFFNVVASSPLYVIYDWANDSPGSFNSDLALSAVPVPAAGFLLLTALGGLGVARRRRKAA